MPLDATVIQPIGSTWRNIPEELATINPAKLKTLMNKEVSKQFGGKSKIVFVDCQSGNDNTGKQIAGAIHMDMATNTMAPAKFNTVIKSVPAVYNKLGSAELVVFYCSLAATRSPAVMSYYKRAVLALETQPATYNKTQLVLLLEGGISAYTALGGLPNLTSYLLAKNGQVVAQNNVGGAGGIVIYTDPN